MATDQHSHPLGVLGTAYAAPSARAEARSSHLHFKQCPSSWPTLFRSSPHREQVNISGPGNHW
jgi:hypothetical protein